MTEQGLEGTPLTITVDANLQHKLQNLLDEAVELYGAKEGGAIVLDPENGDILAAVSSPNFDPNNIKSLNMEQTKCRPITNCFEFGSVIKNICIINSTSRRSCYSGMKRLIVRTLKRPISIAYE